MLKYLLVAALAVAQLVGPPAALATPTIDVSNAATHMQFACNVLHYDCTNIPLPPIRTAPLFFDTLSYGTYNGKAVILDSQILPVLEPVLRDSIIAHELAHYLDHVAWGDVLFDNKATLCASEWNAWRVGNAYVITNGRPDLADFAWAARYGCYR